MISPSEEDPNTISIRRYVKSCRSNASGRSVPLNGRTWGLSERFKIFISRELTETGRSLSTVESLVSPIANPSMNLEK